MFYLSLSIKQRSYEKIMCIYLLFHCFSGENCILYIFLTQGKDFDRLKRNMNDGTVVFLKPLLIVLTWNILLPFSFWYKTISYFKEKIYSFLSTLGGCFSDISIPSFFPYLIFNWHTFSRWVTTHWWHQWAKIQVLTNQNLRNRWFEIARDNLW